MFILLPLALIGVGYLIYLLFGAASYALPLLVGLSIGFASSHAGASGVAALILGTAAFMAVIAAGRMATLFLPSRQARTAVVLLFAVPAAIVAFQVASQLLHFAGSGGWIVVAAAMIAALAIGSVAAKRHSVPN